MSIFCRIDDKHIPLYRVMWVSATPHYCGEEDCVREGSYEIRLEQGESVWASSSNATKCCNGSNRGTATWMCRTMARRAKAKGRIGISCGFRHADRSEASTLRQSEILRYPQNDR